MAEVPVVTDRFAVGRMVLGPEMRSAGFVPLESVTREQFREFQKIGNLAGAFEFLVQTRSGAPYEEVLPELSPYLGDLSERFLQARLASGHACIVPHQPAQLPVEFGCRFLPVYGEESGSER